MTPCALAAPAPSIRRSAHRLEQPGALVVLLAQEGAGALDGLAAAAGLVDAGAVEDGLAEAAEVVAGGGGDLGQEAGLGHPGEGVDLEHVLVLALGDEDVHAARARDTEAAHRTLGDVEHALVAGGREARGQVVLALAGLILRLVVVEGALGRDLHGAERTSVEHADVHLAARDAALDEDRMILSVNAPDSGAAEEELAVAYNDERLEIGFNAKYLLEIASQVDRENAVFLFNSSGDPTLMREGNDTSAVYVVMPMRV